MWSKVLTGFGDVEGRGDSGLKVWKGKVGVFGSGLDGRWGFHVDIGS